MTAFFIRYFKIWAWLMEYYYSSWFIFIGSWKILFELVLLINLCLQIN